MIKLSSNQSKSTFYFYSSLSSSVQAQKHNKAAIVPININFIVRFASEYQLQYKFQNKYQMNSQNLIGSFFLKMLLASEYIFKNLLINRHFIKIQDFIFNSYTYFIMGSAPSEEQEIRQFLGSGYLKKQIEEQITLKIAYFNYGVCSSPFEYQTEQQIGKISQQIADIQAIFQEEYQTIVGKPFDKASSKWKIGKLDALLKKGRYSALYYDDVGILNNKFLMNKTTYQSNWLKAFASSIQCVDIQDITSQALEENKKNLLQMDFVHYRTLVRYAYKDLKMSFEEIVETQPCAKYQKYMKQKFQSAVINQKYKIEKLLRRLKKFQVDIFFLQNIDEKILKIIEKKTSEYRIIKSYFGNSSILMSWKGLKKIVGDSIRPFSYYNKKYLDPNQTYQLSQQTQVIMDQKQFNNTQFDQSDSRSFKALDNKQIKVKNKKKTMEAVYNGAKVSAQQAPKLTPAQQKHIQQKQKQKQRLKQIQMQKQKQLQRQKQQKMQDKYDEPSQSHVQQQKQEIQRYISPKMLDDLIWNNTTIVQFFGSLIFITSNLETSQNSTEQEWMIESFRDLKKAFPNHTIIAAIGIEKDALKVQNYHVFPRDDTKIPTVYKRKTYIQSRIHKAKILNQKTEDYFVSTTELSDAQVIDINQNPMGEKQSLIPNEVHPYDHYILSASFKCTVKKRIKVHPQQ